METSPNLNKGVEAERTAEQEDPGSGPQLWILLDHVSFITPNREGVETPSKESSTWLSSIQYVTKVTHQQSIKKTT